jgi:hypothetical protein
MHLQQNYFEKSGKSLCMEKSGHLPRRYIVFSFLAQIFELCVRPPLKRRSNNPSPLKWTVIFSPLSEDFCYQTGILIPGGRSV